MKKTIYFLVVVCLTACTTPYLVHQGSINNIPLEKEQDEEVELYFKQEKPTKGEWVRVSYVHVAGKPGDSYNSLVNKLKVKASSMKLDGILYIQSGTSQETDTNLVDVLTGEDGDEYTAKTLTGIGFMYLSSLTYLEKKLKTKQCFCNQDDSSSYVEWKATGHYDFHGALSNVEAASKTDKRIYIEKIHALSLQTLLYDELGWAYLKDEYGRVSFRVNQEIINGQRVKMKYGKEVRPLSKEPLQLKVSYNYQNYMIDLIRDDEQRIIEKKVSLNKQPHIVETFTYDEKGRVKNSLYKEISSSATPRTYQCEYTYYSAEDIQSAFQARQ